MTIADDLAAERCRLAQWDDHALQSLRMTLPAMAMMAGQARYT